MEKTISKRAFSLKTILKSALFALLLVLLATFLFDFIRIYPKNVHVTNVTSSSITVSWVTNFESSGLAKAVSNENILPITVFGKDVAFDSRDVKAAELEASGMTSENVAESTSFSVNSSDFVDYLGLVKKTKYFVHHVTITGLNPQSEYKVMVGDGILFNSVAKDVKTTTVPSSVVSPVPAYGTIKDANNQDLPIEELLSVSDAVVYFNYLDEATQAKSNLFSGVLNDTGNWYIDVSGAVDSDGENFVDKYSQTPTNILAEIVIDGGKLGVWKKVVNANEISPIQTIVLNIPNSVTDGSVEGSLEKIQSNSITDIVSKDINAGESCIFAAFCGPCTEKVDGQFVQCSCNQETLDRRNCGGESTKDLQTQLQENASADKNTCSGGGKLGDHVWYGGCKVCAQQYDKDDNPSYAMWVGANSEDCPNGSNGGAVVPKDSTCTGANCGDGDKNDIEMDGKTSSVLCLDMDGCTCLYGKTAESKYTSTDEVDKGESCLPIGGDSCSDKTVGADCLSTQGKGKCEYLPSTPGVKYCKVSGGGEDPCSDLSFGSDCNVPTTNEKGTCKTVPGSKGVMYCDPKGGTIDATATAKERQTFIDKACWEDILFGSIYYYDSVTGGTYKCQKRDWNEVSRVLNCEEGANCAEGLLSPSDRCIDSSGQTLNCLRGKWELGKKTNVFLKEVLAYEIEKISAGTKCPENQEQCFCVGGHDRGDFVDGGDYCQQVGFILGCKLPFSDGKVCSNSGKICVDHKCQSTEDSSSILNLPSSTKVFASDFVDEATYLLDSENGTISGLSEGAYIFDWEGKSYYFSVSGETSDLTIFIDINENGVFDSSVDKKITDFGSELKISTVSQKYDYTLSEGYNFVSFPFLVSNTDSRTAASLLQKLNEVYDDSIYSISKFNGNWKVVGQNSVLYDNNDFQLVPGQGYVIKASEDVDISIVGQPVKFDTTEDSAPILFNLGWNLVGLYGEGIRSYTAESLLDSLNSYQKVDFTADNVSKWDTEVQMYEGLQKTYENGTPMVYGFDFPLQTQSSYFVRVLQGSGNWNPDVK